MRRPSPPRWQPDTDTPRRRRYLRRQRQQAVALRRMDHSTASQIHQARSDATDKAEWTPNTTSSFIRICSDEIRKGNKRGRLLSTKGYANLITRFQQETGMLHDKSQMRNKWQSLKSDWDIWNKLMRNESGLGMDHDTGLITGTDDWWKQKIAGCPGAKKFRYAPLQFADELERLFGGITATGEFAYNPACGQVPNFTSAEEAAGSSLQHNLHESDSLNNHDHGRSSATNTTPNPTQVNARGHFKSGYVASKQKRQKNLEDSWSRIATTLEMSRIENRPATVPPSIKTALDALYLMEDDLEREDLKIWAGLVLKDDKNREMFMLYRTNKDRLEWLKLLVSLEPGYVPPSHQEGPSHSPVRRPNRPGEASLRTSPLVDDVYRPCFDHASFQQPRLDDATGQPQAANDQQRPYWGAGCGD